MSRAEPAIVWELACAMMRDLSGYKGYPKPIDSPGEHHFIRAFQEAVISVEHAQAVVESFDQEFPTVLKIRQTAYDLRARFERQPSPKQKWEQQYGKPDPNWSRNLIGNYESQKSKMQWQAMRDTLYYTEGPGRADLDRITDRDKRRADKEFWTRQALRMRRDHAEELERFRREELSAGWEALMEIDWARELPAPEQPAQTTPRVTQADIDRVQREREASVATAQTEDEDRWE